MKQEQVGQNVVIFILFTSANNVLSYIPPDMAHWLPSIDRSWNFPTAALSEEKPRSVLDWHVGFVKAK